MATTNNLKKGLNRKLWEMCNNAPVNVTAGAQIISSRHYRQQQLFVASSTIQYLYTPDEDGYIQIPSGGFAGTFGSGTSGTAGAVGLTGTATAGSATTLTTNHNIQRDLRGYKIHITGGQGAGDVVEILSNTIGANSVITANFSATITTASTYRILTPRWYFLNAGTVASGSFKVYCYALNTWTTLANSTIPTSITNSSRMAATPSIIDGEFKSFATGTATAGTANTLSNTAKAWATNQWTNYQIRITAGTGLGQIRTIASNTGTQLTVSANWTINPDATSQYSIEGNDDFIYFHCFNSIAMFRYSISANTWTQLANRANSMGGGGSLHFIHSVNDSAWNTENSIVNGRRLYSFRGNGVAEIDYYDIPSNTWTNGINFSPKTETFSHGTRYVYNGNYMYVQKDNTNRFFRFDFIKSAMEGWHVLAYPSGGSVDGDTMFDYTYKDGSTEVVFLYHINPGQNVVFRTIVI